MLTKIHTKQNWIVFSVLLALIALVVWQSPAERTLGNKIKVVYVHVALTWTGIVGFTLMGVTGIATAMQQSSQLLVWSRRLGWLAWGFYLAGHVVSLWAMELTWGSVSWEEPKTIMALLIIGVALVAFALIDGLNSLRTQGIVYATLAIFVHASRQTPLILHPGNAIREGTSSSIQSTSYLLFGLFCIMGSWLLWLIYHMEQNID